jgi:iron complex outermembrane receptor protein
VDGVRNVISPIALTSSISGELDTHSYAAFGEGTYKITDQLSLVGGLRYSIDYKDASDVNLLNPALPEVDSSGNWSNLNYRVSLNYKPDPDSLLYFSTSTGFKSGFISISAYPYPNPQPSVKPEEVTAYEIGYKNEMFGNRLQLAASAFHYDYKDIQLTVNNALSAAAGTVGVNILENAARAKIYGADFDATGKLDAHWSAHFGISWLPTAEYSDFDGGISYVPAPGGLGAVAVASDLSGSRILRSPKTALDLGITYATDIEEGKLGTVQITGNYSRSGDFFMVIGEEAEQPAYSIFNLDVAWTDPSQKYTVALWGRNLGNEAYYLSGLANTGGFSAVWAKPREIGVRLSAAL